MKSKLEKIMPIMLITAPMLLIAALITTYGINVPYWDQWDASVPVAFQVADGTFPLAFLFAQHNEHRIMLTKLTVVLSTWLTGWDARFETRVSFGLAVLTFILLLDLLRFHGTPKFLWLSVPLAWIVFSVRQVDNWIIGFQTQFFYALFLSVLAIWLILRLKVSWRTLIVIILCAFLASWSFSTGLLLWVVLLPGLWLRGYRKSQHYEAWFLAAVACLVLYIEGYTVGARTIAAPTDYLTYVLLFLGAPFVFGRPEDINLAIFIVALGIALFCWNMLYLWRRAAGQLLVAPIVMFLLGLGSAILSALGRIQFLQEGFITQPFSSRYVTIANLIWIALFMSGILSLAQKPWGLRVHANILAFVIAIPLYALANVQAFNAPPIPPLPSPRERTCLLEAMFSSDQSCLFRLFPVVDDRLRIKIQELAKHRLSTFGDWQADFPPASQPALAHTQPILGTYMPSWIGEGPETIVLFQHPPSTAEQHLQLPNAPQVFFEAEIYVNLQYIREHPDVPQTGADFRLGIREGRHVRTLYEGSFDVNVETAPIPIRVDLSAWRGRAVVLVYETLVREGNPSYAHAMWRNPRLTTQ